jgi:alpha-glucosidase
VPIGTTPGEEDHPWWQTAVIYQIYPRSFQDTNNDGIGDLNGITSRLDYLTGAAGGLLGVDAIWISPFYPSPMADFGYDVSDYCGVDPVFGDLAKFDQLLATAHDRGLRVIIDYVPNHTSDHHPWFEAARDSRQDPKRDWYIWADPGQGGSPPNNWGSAFGGPAWSLDGTTGQYYLHQFLPEQPELNWRNPAVEQAMFEVLRFWLDRGVDGFRMDVIGMISKDAQLRDNPSNSKAAPGLAPNDIFGSQLHLHNEDQDEVHAILRRMRRLLDDYEGRCAIGELGYTLERWVRYYGENDELHLPFNFRLMEQPWKADAIRRSVEELEAVLPLWAWPSYVLGSHDAPRLASRIGQAQARTAAMLLLTLRGTPTIYQGDELGLEDGTLAPHQLRDPQGLRLGASHSRDPGRTPMQWDTSPHAGFSTVEPWLPVADDHTTHNVAVDSTDPNSTLNLYRRLLRYRRATLALQIGSYTTVDVGSDDCFGYLRGHPQGSCVVALNFAASERHVSLPGGHGGRVALSTHIRPTDTEPTTRLALRPHEGIIVEVTQ